jgi:hypothetical protein
VTDLVASSHAGVLACFHDEIAHVHTSAERRRCAQHIFDDYFAGLLTQPEADALRAELAAYPPLTQREVSL